MAEGKIKWFNAQKRIGFIEREGGDDLFVHVKQWRGPRGSVPQQDETVTFEEGIGPDGRPEARNVRPLGANIDDSEQPTQAAKQPVQDNDRFLNPYNFVRYLGKPRPDGHILGNCPPPPHDRYVGLTGCITCELKTVTPFFISDSHAVQGNVGEHRTYRFFQVENEKGEIEPALPATSLRGMMRSVFEAATNSCFAVFDGGRFDQRKGELPKAIVPVRVIEVDSNGAKLECLDSSQNLPSSVHLHTRLRRGNEIDIPLMNAASISAYEPHVLDTETDPPSPFSSGIIPTDVKDGDRVAALVSLQPVNKVVYQYFNVIKVVSVQNHGRLQAKGKAKKVFGYVHITGPNIEKKHLERFFFRWDDDKGPEMPDWESIPQDAQLTVTSDTVEEYNQHLNQYWGRHQRQIQRLDRQGKPWPNTLDVLPHPSYFIQENRQLSPGDLVYYIPTSQIGAPILRPILISRLPYKYDRKTLLATLFHHCETYDNLCPACRLFGWVHEEASNLDKKARVAYAGRVRLSHGRLTYHAGTIDKAEDKGIPLAILSTPKPTTTQFYLLDKNAKPNGTIDYNTSDARLRGRKIYRHHGKEPSRHENGYEYLRVEGENGNKDDQNRTVCGVLKEGSTFEFTVDFENLASEELGALLWSLRLEDGMHHRLGYAKPLGFGSATITVKTLEVLQPKQRYGSLKSSGWRPIDEKGWRQWMEAFKTQMKELYGASFDHLPNIKDLKTLVSEPNVKHIHYPRLESVPTAKGENFRWFMRNKGRNVPQTLDLADEDRGLQLNMDE